MEHKVNKHRLGECPDSPNCVSTQTQQEDKKMAPVSFELEPKKVVEIIKGIIKGKPNTQLVKESPNYLHYTFKSRIFGFIDDVEFLIDSEQKLIHFRSASRTGYSDLGVNRKRMTEIMKAVERKLKGDTASQ